MKEEVKEKEGRSNIGRKGRKEQRKEGAKKGRS